MTNQPTGQSSGGSAVCVSSALCQIVHDVIADEKRLSLDDLHNAVKHNGITKRQTRLFTDAAIQSGAATLEVYVGSAGNRILVINAVEGDV